MSIEREINLRAFAKYVETNPELAIELAIRYHQWYWKQKDLIGKLNQQCRKLEGEKAELVFDYESIRADLELEQLRNIALRSRLNAELPNCLPSSPHNSF